MVDVSQEGQWVYQHLQHSAHNSGQRLRHAEEKVTRANKDLQRWTHERGQALLRLARHYLPSLDQQTVASRFAGFEDELQGLLAQQIRFQTDLTEYLQDTEQKLGALEVELREVTDQLNGKVQEREELEDVVATRLQENPAFRDLSRQATQAEERLSRDENRVEEMDREAKEKLPAYEESEIFQYLWEREFATSSYQGKGMTRRLDRWVAKLVEYKRTRAGYEFLQVTPRIMANEVERRREEFEGLMEQVEAMEDEVSDEVGLTEVLRAGEEFGKQRDQLIETIDKEEADRDKAQVKLQTLNDPVGPYYNTVLKRFQEFLGETEVAALKARAAQTPEPKDDRLVAEIAQANKQLKDKQVEHAQLTAELEQKNSRIIELHDIIRRFRLRNYDSARSCFEGGFDARAVVRNYLNGNETGEQLWQSIERHHRFRESGGNFSPLVRSAIDTLTQPGVSRVLRQAMGHVVSGALRGAVGRGLRRRGPSATRRRSSLGRPRGGRFTTGRGF